MVYFLANDVNWNISLGFTTIDDPIRIVMPVFAYFVKYVITYSRVWFDNTWSINREQESEIVLR